ncbi:TPA: glycosyltransferase family 4 protein [Streptococcus suis]
MKKIRVCHIGTGDEHPGGITTVIHNLMGNQELINIEQLHIVSVSRRNRLKVFLKCILKLYIEHKKNPISIAHLHMSEKGSCYRKAIIVYICKALKIKVLVHSHGGKFEEFVKSSSGFLYSIFRKAMSISDAVVVLTPGWKNVWESLVEHEKIYVLPNSVSIPELDERSYFQNNLFNILYLGHISEMKGAFDLILAIKEFSLLDIPFNLKIAGNGEINKAYELLERYNLTSRVELLGWVDEKLKHELLKEADLLILPSHFESFGIVLLEAMSFKVPVICGDGGYSKEIIHNGHDGLIIKSGNINDIVNKMTKLYSENLSEYGNNGRDTVEKFYTHKKIGLELKKIYEEII